MLDNPMMRYITEKGGYTTLPEPLPIMHSCEGFDFESIVENGKLRPSLCPVFNEELLYFFYGKPSYPVGEKEKVNRTDVMCCPVCLIIDIEKIDIFRAFPFDSGAFENKMYLQFLHRHMKIERFEIDNNCDAIRAYISLVFGNNWNYIHGIAKETEAENTYVNALLKMLSANGGFEIDERSNTVEVLSKQCIDIEKEVRGIVLPDELMRKKEISKFIIDNNIEYRTYEVRNMTAPTRYNEIVFQLSMQLIRGGTI